MNKVLIVLMIILLGTSLIVLTNTNKGVESSFDIEYQNNKNIALPNIEGKTELTIGVYRVIEQSGITVDYDIFSGIWTINGTASTNVWILQKAFEENEIYNVSYYYVSGTMTNSMAIGFYDIYTSGVGGFISSGTDNYTQNKNVKSEQNAIQLLIIPIGSSNYNNYKFKIQLEKGSISTSYTVPKLIPVYKDNLSIEEKQTIGFGAFGGVTQIIKTINNIIKPVNDFINGILNLF